MRSPASASRPVRLPSGPASTRPRRAPGPALVATSPSISPLPDDRAAPAGRAPALVADARPATGRRRRSCREVDLFLRLCPAPTIGVTGTKGKTTTSSLTAALLAADPAHPVVLGGNIGMPLVERLPELTPEHRVVDRALRAPAADALAGDDVAVYTNVTSDHLDRHGTLEAYRAVKRRLAELVDPDGAARSSTPRIRWSPGTPASAGRPRSCYRRDRPMPGGLGVVDGWIVAAGVERLPIAGGGTAATGTGRPDHADGRARASPARTTSRNALAAIAAALASASRPTRSARRPRAFTGVEHRLEAVGLIDGVRFINDSQGTQPDAVVAALRALRPAGRADRRRPRQGDRPRHARRRRRRAGRRRGPDRRERPDPRGPIPRRRPRPDRASRRPRRRRSAAPTRSPATCLAAAGPGTAPATVLLSPAAASFDMFVDYAARGRAFKAAVAALAAERTGGPAR